MWEVLTGVWPGGKWDRSLCAEVWVTSCLLWLPLVVACCTKGGTCLTVAPSIHNWQSRPFLPICKWGRIILPLTTIQHFNNNKGILNSHCISLKLFIIVLLKMLGLRYVTNGSFPRYVSDWLQLGYACWLGILNPHPSIVDFQLTPNYYLSNGIHKIINNTPGNM